MEWAAITIIFINVLNAIVHICKHGERKSESQCKYNGITTFIGTAISMLLLYCAGTFDCLN